MKDRQSKRSVTVIFGLENSFNLWMHASLNGVEIGVFRWQFKLVHLWTDDSLSSFLFIIHVLLCVCTGYDCTVGRLAPG